MHWEEGKPSWWCVGVTCDLWAPALEGTELFPWSGSQLQLRWCELWRPVSWNSNVGIGIVAVCVTPTLDVHYPASDKSKLWVLKCWGCECGGWNWSHKLPSRWVVWIWEHGHSSTECWKFQGAAVELDDKLQLLSDRTICRQEEWVYPAEIQAVACELRPCVTPTLDRHYPSSEYQICVNFM